jgi:glycyl-tRNA synthetase
VVETSIGLDRIFLAIISNSYKEEILEDGSERTIMSIPPFLSPYKVAVLPLVKKDGMPEKARKILVDLQEDFNCQYDEKDAIGRRYRRQDAIGTPFCVTIDNQTLEDSTVTVRFRDSMQQVRINSNEINSFVRKELFKK